MKKSFIKAAWLAAAVLLLAGCGNKEQTQTPAAGQASVQKEEAQETVQDPSEGETEGEVTDFDGMPYAFKLVDEEDFSMELMEVLDVEDGGRLFLIRIGNNTEEKLMITLSNVKINDRIIAAGTQNFYPDAGETEITEMADLRDACMLAERNGVRIEKITCDIIIQSWETDENGEYKVLFESASEAAFPENFEPRVVCEPVLSMRAQEQILHEDENVRITLTDLGKFVGTSNYYMLDGIVKVENLSETKIPVFVEGIRINGYYIGLYGSSKGTIPAGSVMFTQFSCSQTDLEKAGITQIETVDLQIMTSEEENTGTIHGRAGGTWYPVVLAEHGSQGEDSGVRIPLYEDDYVAVELTGASSEWREYDWTDPYGRLEWKLAFTNKTDKDLAIRFEDFIIDGQPDTGESGDSYFMSCELGAGSRTNDHISHTVKEKTPLPEISFRVQIRSVGGGTLYSYPEEYVTITQEMLSNLSKDIS